MESLSGKKAAFKKAVRSVLDSPYTPRVINDSGEVADRLFSLNITKEEEQVDWNMLKKMSKEERCRFRHLENAEFLDLRPDLIIGLNEIFRGLQKGLVASLIISDKMSYNSMLGKVLIESAERSCIPVVKLTSLHESFKKLCGIPCHALGVKKTAAENENSKLHSLHKAIVKADNEFRLCKPPTQKEKRNRRKPQPYCRDFYSKRKKISWDKSRDDTLNAQNLSPGNSNHGMSNLELTVNQSKPVAQMVLEDQEGETQLQHYKSLRVKEVLSIKNPPKSKKMNLMKNCK